MMQSLKKMAPHLLVLAGFLVISLFYFYPVLQGKQIYQSDIVQYTGMAKQQNDFRAASGEETYWTNSAFGGMPTYQLGAKYPHNYIKKLDLALRMYPVVPRPVDYLFLYLLGFYVLMLVLNVDYKLAALGALAFGFSTYLIIILGVGHNSKAHAIAYMPLVLAGIILTFQKQYVKGFLLTTLAMGLELVANHYQMTYYLLLLVLVLGLVYLIDAVRKKLIPHFIKSVGILTAAVILAIGLNATNLLATQEYAKESTRSASELTINADGTPKEASSGLERSYITEYSYGQFESLNLFIPRLTGGGNYEKLGKDSNTYDAYRKLGASPIQALEEANRAPMYWGDQPIVEAPAYVGAVVLFLFVFALFIVKGRLKWWLVGGILLSLMLSWGKNFFLSDLFIDYFPLYNKFRAVSSIQVILELCVPILAIFGIHRLLNDFEKGKDKLKALKLSTLIVGGVAILLLLLKGQFTFVGSSDSLYMDAYGFDFVEALKDDRKAIYTSDTLRSLLFVLLSAGVIWFYLKKKLSENLVILCFAILILADLSLINKRYVNDDDFVAASVMKRPFQANQADKDILEDDSHYRVFDLTTGSTRPSFFHNSLSGYHAAKMRRYNELFEFHITQNNLEVINMLNTKYLISQDEQGQPFAFENPEANGNAWFIERTRKVNTADEEIKLLDSLNTNTDMVYLVDEGVKLELPESYTVDSTATITLVDVKPNYLKYETANPKIGFAVFSEIYYQHGWQAYLDNEPWDHLRVNYVLRGMEVPAGNHTIEFKFEPQVVQTGTSIALASSALVFILLVAGIYWEFKNT